VLWGKVGEEMSDDLIKRVCQSWVDAGLGDETFWENWPNCPTDDTLTANQVLARIEELERENARLVSEVNIAKYGEPNFAWSIHNAVMADLQAKLAKAVEALVAEREENLWNAYNIGVEYGGRWSDACMSDAEWLVDQCGLDPEFKDHDANAIKAAIPTAARAVLSELEGGE